MERCLRDEVAAVKDDLATPRSHARAEAQPLPSAILPSLHRRGRSSGSLHRPPHPEPRLAVLGELLPTDLATTPSPTRATSSASGCIDVTPQEQHGLVGERRQREARDRAVEGTACLRCLRIK